MKSSTIVRLSILLALGLLGASCSGGSSPAQVPGCSKIQPAGFPTVPEAAAVGSTAPDFHLKDIDGNDVCLRDYTGKVVMINASAGWCGPCRSETPALQQVYSEKKGEGFEVLMTMIEDYDGGSPDLGFIADWIDKYDVTFHVLPDPQEKVYGVWGTGYIPQNVLVDRDQVVRYSQAGAFTSASNIRNRIQPYLDQPALLEY